MTTKPASRLATAGFQFSMPLYSGGGSNSRLREAYANRDKLTAQLEETRRKAGTEAKQAYLGVINGLAQTEALRSAVESGESSVKGNQAGYKLGIRINSDVLNSQQQLFASRRDMVKARYDTLLARASKLKAGSRGVVRRRCRDVKQNAGALKNRRLRAQSWSLKSFLKLYL